MKKCYPILVMMMICCNINAQDFALKKLEKSTLFHKWVEIPATEDRLIRCFVAYPEETIKTQAILVIHDNLGLTDWTRSFADQLAQNGYLAIVPDLLSSFSEKYSNSNDFSDADQRRSAIYRLDRDRVSHDLDSVYQYIKKDTLCNGKISVMGFGWGGAQSFRYASNNQELATAHVFYGTPPKVTYAYKSIETPVYGFYGAKDQAVNSTIATAELIMNGNNKFYEHVTYPSAEHAFMKLGDYRKGGRANKKARKKAWKRIVEILEGI